MKKAIYLKTNRIEDWAIDNLHIWMKIAVSLEYDAYIICDNDHLCDLISGMEFSENFTIIRSIRDQEVKPIVEKVTVPRWHKAAYAHLTTFFHAKKMGYDWIWNIDADDTLFCLPIDRVVDCLKQVEEYAIEKRIDCFSLDMWYSKLGGTDWSFGITYSNAQIDWGRIIREYSANYQTGGLLNENIDNYFHYLRKSGAAKIETWYLENLRFIHFAVDMMRRFVQSGVYHWKDGVLYSPIAGLFGEMNEVDRFCIVPDTIKFDIGITDEESKKTVLYCSRDGHERSLFPHNSWTDIEGRKIVLLRQKEFNVNKFGKEDVGYILFGAGSFCLYHLPIIQKYNRIRFVADNNEEKQGEIISGVKCIAKEEIMDIENSVVVIMTGDLNSSDEISKQLSLTGIKSIHIKEWERAVFADDIFM